MSHLLLSLIKGGLYNETVGAFHSCLNGEQCKYQAFKLALMEQLIWVKEFLYRNLYQSINVTELLLLDSQ